MPVLKPNEEAHLQGILEQIPDLDEAIESLDETGERMQWRFTSDELSTLALTIILFTYEAKTYFN